MRSSLGTIIWVVIGIVVASAHHYFNHVGSLRPIVSAVLAVALLLFGLWIESTCGARCGPHPRPTPAGKHSSAP